MMQTLHRPLSIRTIITVLVIALCAVVWFSALQVRRHATDDEPLQNASTTPANSKIYGAPRYGIIFTYPEKYVLSERSFGDAYRGQHTITLIDKKDIPIPSNAEGPTALTISVYEHAAATQTLLGWLMGSRDSNYRQDKDAYATTTFLGIPAVQYRWSGLYEGQTTAFIHEDNIIAISVTYQDINDRIREDYVRLLESFHLSAATTTPELM